ncbi:uncharacterized protein [Primulina eburnea]|uniref:uncharacterized protein n=1 Tax=Primulina eburnea TaxID=1245227 RepID=UPI003C6C8F6D
MGDFNNVLSKNEKKGGLPVKNYETKDFVDCVASLDLLDLPSTVDFVAPGCISDHTLAIVSMFEQRKQLPKQFNFFNMWTMYDDFRELITANWKFCGYGIAQYMLKQKFLALKKPLQTLNRNKFSSISARASAMKNKLENLQLKLLEDGDRATNYAEIQRQTVIMLEAERMFIAQKAKIPYLKQGDRCTKFFHDLIKINHKRNAIISLTRLDGSICDDPKDIADCFVEYY